MNVESRDELARTPAHETALACIEAGIEAAQPKQVVRESVALDGTTLRVEETEYDLAEHDEILVLGGGKAAAGVAAALESVLGERLDGGAVVTATRDAGSERDTSAATPSVSDRVTALPGSHPVPDESSVESTEEILERARAAGPDTLVLAVVTGGASALLAAPDVPLDAMRETTDALLGSGAPIDEMNAVRKRLSRIKGGGLARAAAPATVVTLALSDVVGDDPGVIGSGPTVPDDGTHADARRVIEQRNVSVPESVREHLRGEEGGDPIEGGPVHMLANALTALDAAREAARERGYAVSVLSTRFGGEARDTAAFHRALADEALDSGNPLEPPAVLLSGGETTVDITGSGTGGPNLEFAVRAGIDFEGVCAAVDTDGRDGSTDAAGALVDSETVSDPDAARAALDDNDALPYLGERDCLIRTGRTGTNVNDLRIFVLE